MKICMVISFYYMWNNYSNIKSNYEYLIKHGYSVDLYSKQEFRGSYSKYDLIFLMGSGTKLSEKVYNSISGKVFSFGFSDPNLYQQEHFANCDQYFTNDLTLSKKLKGKPIYYYQTTCDKNYHIDLNLKKETDILVYGAGAHKFVTDRNETVNKLRNHGFKIKVFGRGWDKNPHTYKFIEGEELAKEICQTHIVLDLSNKTTAWPHRIFESSARGTPIITIDREDTRTMFNEGSEILLYNNFGNLVGLLYAYLKNPKLLRMIGKRAQARCYKDHDISVRIKELLKIMELL